HPQRRIVMEALLYLVEISRSLGDTLKMAADYERLRDCMRSASDAFRNRATMKLAAYHEAFGDDSEARRLYEEVASSYAATEGEKTSARQSLRCLIGVQQSDSNQYEEARATFLKVIAEHDRDDEFRSLTLLKLANCYLALRSSSLARNTYAEVLACAGASDAAKANARDKLAYTQGLIYFESADYSRARTQLEAFTAQRSVDESVR